jgi:hypothetical protein
MYKRYSSILCLQESLTADLNVRFGDLYLQNSATGVLLSSVQSVAQINKAILLPGWPVSHLGSPADVLSLMHSLPSLADLDLSSDLCQVLSSHFSSLAKAKQYEVLLSWISTRFRGVLVAATGTYIIPGLNGVAQFLVIDGQPENDA